MKRPKAQSRFVQNKSCVIKFASILLSCNRAIVTNDSPSGTEPSQIGFSVEGILFFLVDLNLFSFVWRLSLKIQNMDQPKSHSQFSFMLV